MLGWRRFVRVVVAGFFGILGVLAVFVLLMNPYGNLPHLVFATHAITDINQRFQYPALIRSGKFDSIVIGTSDARLLYPPQLDEALGGHFANLAMNSGMAWEQYRLADLFMRTVPKPSMLLVALDHVWCDENADTNRTTDRGFPNWMYDDNRWNDLAYMLNGKSVEISGRRLATALGLQPVRFEAGYDVFTPPEDKYDRVKVRTKLWGNGDPHAIAAVDPPYTPTEEERASWRFPALAWLDEMLGRFQGRKILAFMPVHVVAQPVPGSRAAVREEECKSRIVAIANRHEALPIVDFRISSAITTNDDNYWDPLHYRLPIATRIVSDLAEALKTGANDPGGDWRVLPEPSVAAMPSRN
jgi:hypothetical protein